eukprot:CAMPEP_0176086576 /NCGR_PEP_ID=MMETSP0120_2-20121206/43337_1 /TAXON_ID=160619 /ORGANISM="Kryptoperidinium foliaceum, Strain CCMP 1326" /LENGTH=54 /DNA_ID=CAMNT_0017420407 /DNA_START=208 /DNA_END=369 /DNA_ORIENTATION=+
MQRYRAAAHPRVWQLVGAHVVGAALQPLRQPGGPDASHWRAWQGPEGLAPDPAD